MLSFSKNGIAILETLRIYITFISCEKDRCTEKYAMEGHPGKYFAELQLCTLRPAVCLITKFLRAPCSRSFLKILCFIAFSVLKATIILSFLGYCFGYWINATMY